MRYVPYSREPPRRSGGGRTGGGVSGVGVGGGTPRRAWGHQDWHPEKDPLSSGPNARNGWLESVRLAWQHKGEKKMGPLSEIPVNTTLPLHLVGASAECSNPVRGGRTWRSGARAAPGAPICDAGLYCTTDRETSRLSCPTMGRGPRPPVSGQTSNLAYDRSDSLGFAQGESHNPGKGYFEVLVL